MESAPAEITHTIDEIPLCVTDNDGIFKYVQISCNSTIYVRGFAKYKYHKYIYHSFKEEIDKLGLSAEDYPTKVLGGGRIKISATEKKISVYGYSHAYGRCKHATTCTLLQKVFPDYTITWSNNGY